MSTAALPFASAFVIGRFRSLDRALSWAGRGEKMTALVEVEEGGAPLYLNVSAAHGQRAERAGFSVRYVPRSGLAGF